MNLEGRIVLLDDTSIDFSKNDKALMTDCEDLPINDELYNLDLKLIENISFLKEKFEKLEAVMQCLSISANQYKNAIEFKTVLKEMKQLTLKENINSNNSAAIVFFLKKLHRHLPSYISIAKNARKYLQQMLDIHQKHICDPLGIKSLKLDEKVVKISCIFDELLK